MKMLPYILLFVVVSSGTYIFTEKKSINRHKRNVNYEEARESAVKG